MLLISLHLLTVLPAALLGAYLLASRKGTPRHRALGKGYMVLMLVTASIALLMPATVGPRLLGHFGFIHIFCLIVLVSVPRAWFAIRRGDRVTHQRGMVFTYVGAIVIAGAFTLAPGRMIHGWLFGSQQAGTPASVAGGAVN